jgi:type I restriction enzyme M protein
VVDLIVQMLSGDYGEAARIHDPYVRGGELLAGVLGFAGGSVLSGASPSDDMLRITGMHLLLSGGRADLHRGTATPWNQPTAQQADLIVANIPFNSRVPAVAKTRKAGQPPLGGGNYLWLQHIIASLRRAGRAIVLMPNQAAVSTDDGEQSVRARMIQEGAIEFMVALPRGLFAATRVGAMIWGLRAPAERPGSVLFIDIRQAGSKRGAQRVLASAEIRAVADCLRSWRSGAADFASSIYGTGKAAAASAEEIRQRDYSLEPSDYFTDQLLDPGPAATAGAPDLAAAVAVRARAAWEADEKTARIVTTTGNGYQGNRRRTYLNEICDPQAGPPHSMVKQAERAWDGIPLIVPANLRGHRIRVSGAELMSARTAWEMARFQLRADDILFVRTGSAGPVALVTEAEEGWLFGTNLIRLRCREDVEPGYLLAVLSSRPAQRWIRARTESATAIPSISAKSLGKLPVNLPPLKEQRRVSELLAEVDTQIAAHRALAETAQDWRAVLADGLTSGLLTAGGPGEQP